MKREIPASERLLRTGEVALMFRVKPVTVTRWANAGKLEFTTTPGGARRYREADVRAMLDGTYEMPDGSQ